MSRKTSMQSRGAQRLLYSCSLSLLTLWIVLVCAQPAMAYIGPGAGLAAIGAFIALVVAVLAALFGFLYFPIKRLIKKRREAKASSEHLEKGVEE